MRAACSGAYEAIGGGVRDSRITCATDRLARFGKVVGAHRLEGRIEHPARLEHVAAAAVEPEEPVVEPIAKIDRLQVESAHLRPSLRTHDEQRTADPRTSEATSRLQTVRACVYSILVRRTPALSG
eukprot:4692338-Pleurochrysis_carterae.AAC.1